jgi:hypothetical protein
LTCRLTTTSLKGRDNSDVDHDSAVVPSITAVGLASLA